MRVVNGDERKKRNALRSRQSSHPFDQHRRRAMTPRVWLDHDIMEKQAVGGFRKLPQVLIELWNVIEQPWIEESITNHGFVLEENEAPIGKQAELFCEHLRQFWQLYMNRIREFLYVGQINCRCAAPSEVLLKAAWIHYRSLGLN